MSILYYDYFASPVGSLLLVSDGASLVELGFPDGKAARRHQPEWIQEATLFTVIKEQLKEYFAGERQEFSFPIAPHGTAFQLQVWNALRRIPYGTTISYGELARQIGRPSASRAVGAANGKNPLPVVIPCHRVIGSSGKLVGFGGGLATKQRLLALEQEAVAPRLV